MKEKIWNVKCILIINHERKRERERERERERDENTENNFSEKQRNILQKKLWISSPFGVLDLSTVDS